MKRTNSNAEFTTYINLSEALVPVANGTILSPVAIL